MKLLPDLILEIAEAVDEKIAEAETTVNSISQAIGTFTGKGG